MTRFDLAYGGRRGRTALLTGISSAAMLAAPVHAQTATTAPTTAAGAAAAVPTPEPDASVAEIVVTGTRTRSAFSAPTPTQVIGAEDLQQRGATNVYAILSEQPAFSSRLSGASNGIRTQTVGQTFADLRGLGSPRTLVLVDGRRFVPSVPASSVGNPYQVDLNLIPSLMLDRVDIVTGGASAQWGSDAVAGVVNMVLRKRFEGVQGEVQTGISERGDAREYRAGAVAGTSFAGGRGHIVVSGDYSKNTGIGSYRDRAWAGRYFQFFTDPGATAVNGRPAMVLRSNTQAGNFTGGGLIVNASTNLSAAARAALIGLQFDSATTVSRFVRGDFNPATTITTFSANQAGGNNPDRTVNSLIPAVERGVAFGRAEYEIADALTVFAVGSYGNSTGSSVRLPSRDRTGIYDPVTASGSQIRINADNPFIPAVLRPLIPAPTTASTATPPASSFTLGRINYDNELPVTRLKDIAWTAAVGAGGKFGRGWTWDGSYTHGRNNYFVQSLASRDRARYTEAADAIVNPANGQIICRSTLTNPGNGCVPLNLFGEGSPSAAAQAYYLGTSQARVIYVQDAAQLNLQGQPFSTWAGPVALAAGVEYRHESIATTVDARSRSNVYDSGLGSDFRGRFTVKEGYFEATVPLLANMSFAKSLAVNGAVRHADYSGFGGVTTWKAGATYEPIDGLLLRAGRSLDIRAPSLYELNVPSSISVSTVTLRGVNYAGVRVSNEGNQALRPEKARTLTVGGSYAPSFLRGLRASVDYYDIKLNGVIAAVGRVQIADNCTAGIQSFCNLLTFNTAGALIGVKDQFVNLASYHTNGIDFTANYDTPLFAGRLNLRGTATYVKKFVVTIPTVPGAAPLVLERAGSVNSNNEGTTPHWRANASVTYSQGPASLSLQTRFVNASKYDATLRETPTATLPADISKADNSIPAYFLFNLSGTIDVIPQGGAQFFWVVNNLFDRDPPIIPSVSTLLQTNGAYYDEVGRAFKIGVRFKF